MITKKQQRTETTMRGHIRGAKRHHFFHSAERRNPPFHHSNEKQWSDEMKLLHRSISLTSNEPEMLISRIDATCEDDELFGFDSTSADSRKLCRALTTSGHSLVTFLSGGFREGILLILTPSASKLSPLLPASLDMLLASVGHLVVKMCFVGSWDASGLPAKGVVGSAIALESVRFSK
jgi:hypothetical protein